MKTNKILAKTPEKIIELQFKKEIDLPEEKWLKICRHFCFSDEIINVYDGNTHHICKYCGGIAKGIDTDILCEECRDDFGHSFYSEL